MRVQKRQGLREINILLKGKGEVTARKASGTHYYLQAHSHHAQTCDMKTSYPEMFSLVFKMIAEERRKW